MKPFKMQTKFSHRYIFLSASFILTPPLCTWVLIWLAYKFSVDIEAAVLSDILWPTTAASLFAAVMGWAIYLRPSAKAPRGKTVAGKKTSGGKRAGLLTVFLCYLFGALPMAIAAGSWDGFLGIAKTHVVIFLGGQIATGWITYPIGAVFGRWIEKRMG